MVARAKMFSCSTKGLSARRSAESAGIHVWPPSVLRSRKTSKNELIMKPPAGMLRTAVLPSEALDGLSRTIIGFGPPVVKFNERHSSGLSPLPLELRRKESLVLP